MSWLWVPHARPRIRVCPPSHAGVCSASNYGKGLCSGWDSEGWGPTARFTWNHGPQEQPEGLTAQAQVGTG